MNLEALHDSGELTVSSDGCLWLSGRPLAIFTWFDAQFAGMAAAEGATALRAPSVIARDVLDRAGFFESFGDRATPVGGELRTPHILLPALCYHAYARHASATLESPVRYTIAGRCYRREADHSPLRLWEFTMREVIFIGTAAWVVAERRRWIDRIASFARTIGLDAAMVQATDPFFVAGARGQMLMQQLKDVKYELRVNVGASDALAIASMNLHETFFGTRFGMTMGDTTTASSGCVAFGLERWMLAAIAALGIDRAAALAAGGGRA